MELQGNVEMYEMLEESAVERGGVSRRFYGYCIVDQLLNDDQYDQVKDNNDA